MSETIEREIDPETGIGNWMPQDVIEEVEWIVNRLCLEGADNVKEIKSVLRVHLYGRQERAIADRDDLAFKIQGFLSNLEVDDESCITGLGPVSFKIADYILSTRASSSRAETGVPVAWLRNTKMAGEPEYGISEPFSEGAFAVYATPTSSHGELAEARRLALEEAATICDGLAEKIKAELPKESFANWPYIKAAAAIRALANMKEG